MIETIMEPDRLLGVELRHLVALQAVARECSFGGAARSLGYTQSAVSQQIAALEKAVGVRLVERPGGPRPVSLTEAGEVLSRHTEQVLSRLRAAGGALRGWGAGRAHFEALAAGSAGTVRVGTFQSAGARVLPPVLVRFRADW